MRPVLVPLTMLLALASWGTAAAPPVTMRSADRLDYLFLGSDRPYLLRLHVRVGDQPYGARWDGFMDRMFAWFDKDKDGCLSPAEAARLPQPNSLRVAVRGGGGAIGQAPPFAALDADKDGKVSKEELRAFYRDNGFSPVILLADDSLAGQAGRINSTLLERLGGAKDGKLTAGRVAGLYDKLRPLDQNEDEIVTRTELDTKNVPPPFNVVFAYDPGLPSVPPGHSLQPIRPGGEDALVKALLAKYDRNRDGKLSREELGLSRAAFARLHADGDGSLGRAELAAYLTSAAPDLAVRLQLGNPTPAKGLIGRLDFDILNPRVRLVNDKTIDPALKKKYRRGPGDSCSVDLGDTRLSIQIPSALFAGAIVDNKQFYFQAYDQVAGKKGHVTRDDLKAPAYQGLQAIFAQADKDADGKLTRAELGEWLDFVVAARDALLTLTGNDLGRGLFHLLDADGDGGLSLREMRSAWGRLAPLARGGSLAVGDLPRTMRLEILLGGGASYGVFAVPPAARAFVPRVVNRPGTPAWFRKMDRNGDGDVSPREWLGTEEEFKAIDADGDGLLSADEAIKFEAKKTEKP